MIYMYIVLDSTNESGHIIAPETVRSISPKMNNTKQDKRQA